MSASTVRRLIARGEIKAIPLTGRIIRIEETEIARFVAKRKGEACQSIQTVAVDIMCNSAAKESAFIASARKVRRERKRKNSKRNSGANFLQLVR